ncbi:MAG: hypothetical protein A2787_04590 [Omnitrophica WOR_2 bacterium RIFCSPHIGHO2_01_FULL_48_9]|uniref:Mce/MlaD domain-containing protein n=1 Tax=Candidatus Sungbacteria bacterium RIFCSPHIGHO2_02_FULL_47_11 TaxID=1802270 RepID=A0A1G2KFV8_9BACT|nr:MAG: hypothetical protein A2787_04590 [Omnitrophica WOR_2 bacterium RIFCSPHIGHO2_01_FULL_48_9]OGZ98143.1 MAG: hypothetical protein A3C07_04960 [Candidatus Sungbacteria bacterium RIFCSPHIGHO2_02_FULL_47_11]
MKFTNETKIGIMVTGVLVVLAFLTFKTGNYRVSVKGYELKVHFYNIDGVDKNAPVRLNGMEVGAVKDMRIAYGEDSKMELTLSIFGETKIHEGAKAFVKNMGLFGEKYVGLTLGDSTKDYLKPGALIVGQEPADFEKILADGEVIAANLKEISQQINDRLKINAENIDEILANMQVASKHIASISVNVDERLQVNKLLIDETIANVNSATRNFDEMSYDLKLNPWKLMYRERVKKTDQPSGKEQGK